MEQDLFDWNDWDILDTGVFQFSPITLKVPIGPFKAGDTFAVAVVSYQEGRLTLFAQPDDPEPVFTTKLGLVVREVGGLSSSRRPSSAPTRLCLQALFITREQVDAILGALEKSEDAKRDAK